MNVISLTRKIFTDQSTIGRLVFGDLNLWTLEDTARRKKVAGQTCIPSGSYFLEIRESSHFKRPMPFLVNVPFYDGIMIHPGNVPLDTNGCILVGMSHSVTNRVDQSRDAFNLLFQKIEKELKTSPLKINIAGGFTKEDFENHE